MAESTIKNHATFVWSVADLLRGDYKQFEYGKVILPLVVLRRLDCVLEPTKPKVLAEHQRHGHREAILRAAAGQPFSNTSKLDLRRLLDDPNHVAASTEEAHVLRPDEQRHAGDRRRSRDREVRRPSVDRNMIAGGCDSSAVLIVPATELCSRMA